MPFIRLFLGIFSSPFMHFGQEGQYPVKLKKDVFLVRKLFREIFFTTRDGR